MPVPFGTHRAWAAWVGRDRRTTAHRLRRPFVAPAAQHDERRALRQFLDGACHPTSVDVRDHSPDQEMRKSRPEDLTCDLVSLSEAMRTLCVLNSARSRSRLSADCQQGDAIYWEMRVATLGLMAAKLGNVGCGGSQPTLSAALAAGSVNWSAVTSLRVLGLDSNQQPSG